MSLERMTVSLDDFLKYLMKQWKVIVFFVLLGMAFAVGATALLGTKIEILPSEEYADLKEQEESFEDYMENSIVMQIDPMNVFEKTIFIKNVSDQDALKDYLSSNDLWSQYTQSISSKYLREVVSWEENSESENIELTVCHSDETSCGELSEYIADKIQQYDENAEVRVGTQRVTMDEEISDNQMWAIDRLNDIKGQLEIVSAGCTIEVSRVTAMILGILIGGLLSIILLWAKFLMKENFKSH